MPRPLAFSTLGCPGMPVSDVLELARRFGYRGLELRCGKSELASVDLDAAARGELRGLVAAGGVEPVCVASYVQVADGSVSDDDCRQELEAHVELALDLGAPNVRVFPGAQDPGPRADERAARRLGDAAEMAAAAGVTLLLETHDSHPTGADLARVLHLVDHPGVRALWDLVHPWSSGEDPTTTARYLAPWLAHVQVKDAVRNATASAGTLAVLPGTGELPLVEILALLDQVGYDGWLSLEYELAWQPQLPPIEQALPATVGWLESITPAGAAQP